MFFQPGMFQQSMQQPQMSPEEDNFMRRRQAFSQAIEAAAKELGLHEPPASMMQRQQQQSQQQQFSPQMMGGLGALGGYGPMGGFGGGYSSPFMGGFGGGGMGGYGGGYPFMGGYGGGYGSPFMGGIGGMMGGQGQFQQSFNPYASTRQNFSPMFGMGAQQGFGWM